MVQNQSQFAFERVAVPSGLTCARHAGAGSSGRGPRLRHHAARMAGGLGGEASRRAAVGLQRALLAQVQVRHPTLAKEMHPEVH